MKIFNLPDLGEGLAEAEVREWYVQEGEVVQVDQPLVSMETAKAVVDVPSPYAGKIVRLHGKVNEVIPTGAPLITYEIEGMSAEPAKKNSVVGALEESSKKWDEGNVIVGSANTRSNAVKAMPAARVLAQQMQVDLSKLTGSGPQGLITPDDVKKHLASKSSTHTALSDAETLHGVRRAMANAMVQSHQEVVPVTIVEDADVTHLPAKTDITARILQAICAAAKEEPALNAWFDGKNMQRKLFTEVNIGLAADTPEGLFVPVVKDAQNQSLESLRTIIDKFKVGVKDRSLAASEMQGATITLSNFGTLAGRYATPIVVPPMVAILGCGKSREIPIVREGKIEIGKVIPFSLTFDHRAVTGGEATRFLAAIIKHLST